MKVVTVNVPESYIDAINKLIGENGLYPSRSELIRCAVREFLLKELRTAKNMAIYNEPEFEESFDDKNFVRVPVEKTNDKNELVREFKTFKIVQRLDTPLPTRDDKNKPWEYTKPKKLLRLFPTEINLDLTISHLAERETLTPEELKKLMGYNSKEQYRDVLRINKEYPDLILRKWGRGLHNARQLESFTINREKLKELLK